MANAEPVVGPDDDRDPTLRVRMAEYGFRNEVALDRGATLGRYVILQRIGAGGMGVVYRAYDPKLQREVALKQLLHGALGSAGEARLVAEAQAMAQLNHPNVISVYDVDKTDTGLVLAMEFVQGQTLRRWLKAARPWQEVLATIRDAGRGLEAAHAAGLVHRDFKPANVLVGDDRRVRVMDFGLARLGGHGDRTSSESRSGELLSRDLEALRTSPEAGVVGTPVYMAPEQHAGAPASAAADQYAFCLVLWEGLCRERPFTGELEALRVAKLGGPPGWPDAAGRSGAVPRVIREAVFRGLAPDPADRWPSMTELLAVLDRDPVAMRRRWLAVSVFATASLLGGGALAVWQSQRSEVCSGARAQLVGTWDDARRREVERAMLASDEAYAQTVWARASNSLDQYAERWAAMHRDACEATAVRGEQSTDVLDLRMACLHRASVELDAVVDVLIDGGAASVEHALEVVDGLPNLQRCADVDALRADVAPPDDPAVARAVDAVRASLATVRSLEAAGRWDAAFEAVDPLAAEADATGYAPVQAEVRASRGDLLGSLGKLGEAQDDLRRAYELAVASRHDDVAVQALVGLVHVVGTKMARFEVGQAIGEIAVAQAVRHASGQRLEAGARGQLGNVYVSMGQFDRGIEQLRRALELDERRMGSDDPLLAGTLNNLAIAYHLQENHAEAAEHYQRALRALESVYPEHPHLAAMLNNLALVWLPEGRTDEALRAAERALAIKQRELGPRHPSVAGTLSNIGKIHEARGDLTTAERYHRDALALKTEGLGADHVTLAYPLLGLGRVERALGRHAEARAHLQRAMELREQGDVGGAELAEAQFELASTLWHTPEHRQQALALARAAKQGYQTHGESKQVEVVEAWLASREG